MKKLFLALTLLTSLLLVTGCDTICSIAKTGTNLISTKIATRWECDQTKLYNFMIEPVAKVVCEEEQPAKGIEDVICPIALGFLTDLGAAEISSRFS